MIEKNKTERELRIESLIPILEDALNKDLTTVSISIEPLPSVHEGTSYHRVFITPGEESYILKRFLPGEGENGFVRTGIPKNPASKEFALMELYRAAGANVPMPYSYSDEPSSLLIEDMGTESLELRVRGKEEDERVALTSKALEAIADFHRVGRSIQGEVLVRRPKEEILSRRNLIQRLKSYYAVITASEDRIRNGEAFQDTSPEGWNEFKTALSPVIKNILGEDQLIHGDLTSYHLFFRTNEEGEETVWIVDHGNPGFDVVAFDCAPGGIFSQDTAIPLHRTEEVFYTYLEKARLEGVRGSKVGLKQDIVTTEFETLLNAGIITNLRRLAKARKLRLRHPEIYEGFISAHPTYNGSEDYYRKTTPEIVRFILESSDRFRLLQEDIRNYERLARFLDNMVEENVINENDLATEIGLDQETHTKA